MLKALRNPQERVKNNYFIDFHSVNYPQMTHSQRYLNCIIIYFYGELNLSITRSVQITCAKHQLPKQRAALIMKKVEEEFTKDFSFTFHECRQQGISLL